MNNHARMSCDTSIILGKELQVRAAAVAESLVAIGN
jgi:hypothetical protein